MLCIISYHIMTIISQKAYIPNTDTYIEKDAQINEEIDRLRHASTQSLLTHV